MTALSPWVVIDSIQPDLSASRAKGALLELTGLVVKASPELDPNVLLEAFERRELLQSTAVLEGVAFPQASLPQLPAPIIAIARSVGGVSFNSLDGEDTHLFVALVTSEEAPQASLQLLARLTRLFQNQKKLKQHLLEATEADRILEIFTSAEACL